jgi:hypothetical protein
VQQNHSKGGANVNALELKDDDRNELEVASIAQRQSKPELVAYLTNYDTNIVLCFNLNVANAIKLRDYLQAFIATASQSIQPQEKR